MKVWLAPGGLHVEPAEIGDAAVIAKLHSHGFRQGWPREDFVAYIQNRDTPIYVACDARRRIAGFAMLRHLGDEAELITIAVDPKWRKKRIGVALMNALLDDLRMSPARRLILEVAADNAAAIRLYAHFGFRRIAERRGYYPRPDGSPATAIVMARDLG